MLKLNTKQEIAQLVLDGKISAEEAGAFLLAREIRKLPQKQEAFA